MYVGRDELDRVQWPGGRQKQQSLAAPKNQQTDGGICFGGLESHSSDAQSLSSAWQMHASPEFKVKNTHTHTPVNSGLKQPWYGKPNLLPGPERPSAR